MAYDLSGSSYQNNSFLITAQNVLPNATNPEDIAFNDDGSKMFILSRNAARVYEFSLSTNYDPTTATAINGTGNPVITGTGARGLAFSNTGNKMFVVSSGNGLDEYALGTNFDLSTAGAASGRPLAPYAIQNPTGIAFNTNGTSLIILAGQLRQVVVFTLQTGFDTVNNFPLGVTAVQTYDYGANVQLFGTPTGIAFNDDGTKMFISDSSQAAVYYFTLTTAFNPNSVSNFTLATDDLDTSSEDTTPTGIVFNGNGTRIFVLGDQNDSVFEYSSGTVSSGGGDPYIIPMKGPMYKLPDEKACYRFYENGNTIINTRVSYFDKSKEIEKYFTNNESVLNPIKKGYWFDKLYINVAGNACIFDLKKWCWLTNKKAINFFKFKPCKKFTSENNEYINGDKCISLKITWEINNKKTGIIVQSYKNPQIDNNIVMINPLFENSYGLSVRNYKPRLTKIKKLTNVSSIKSKIIKAKNKYTQKCVRKPDESWWKDGKLKAIGNKTF